MGDIYDLFSQYSEQGKMIDLEFIQTVIQVMREEEGLEKFIKKVQEYYQSDSPSKDVMEYNSLNRILIINTATANLRHFHQEEVQISNIHLLRHIFYVLERVKQQKKLLENDCDFEQMLLSISLYKDVAYYQQGWLAKLFLRKFGIYLDSELFGELRKLQDFNQQCGVKVPNERMAEIQSLWSVYQLILQDSSIDKRYFENILLNACRSGYEQKDGLLLSPTERYLEGIQQLGIPDINELFDHNFRQALSQANREDVGYRWYLGLPVTSEEYQMKKFDVPEDFESCVISRKLFVEPEDQKVKKKSIF